MSNYEKSIFPCSVHSTVNLLPWRPKDANVTLISFPSIHVYSIHRDNYSRKKRFFENHMTNVVTIDEIRKEL